MTARRTGAVVILLVACATPTSAGGPLVVATDGAGVGWSTAIPVGYRTDLGRLGILANADAVALVDQLFAVWTDVPSATIRFARTGSTAVDVDATNFGPFLGPYGGATAPRHENVIVFDADGSIFDTLFGIGSGVLGFAGPVFLSDGASTVPIGDAVPPGARIVEAIAFVNGKWIDGVDDPAARNSELSLARFQAVFVHEFGHFAGLDHTQIHGLHGPTDSDSPRLTTPIETMFPFAVDETQASLGRDDVVALSSLYPEPTFATATGRITGRIIDADGIPLSGINVVARNVADAADAVSYVSGATLRQPGDFVLAGLAPGASYTVDIEPIDAFHSGGSGVGPFSPPVLLAGPPEGWNGDAESADPAIDDPAARTPVVAAAGVTVTGVDVITNRQVLSVANAPLEPGSQTNALAIADFDRDGIPDFVTTQFGFDPGNVVRFFRGVGGGSFAPPAVVASFPGNQYVVAGQLNAGVDDFPDIAAASDSLKEVRVYFGDGTGRFGPPQTVVQASRTGTTLRGLALGDLDGDPFPDLVTLVEQPDASAVAYALRGSASGQWTIVTTVLAAGSGFPRGGLTVAPVAGAIGDVLGIASTGSAAQGPPALGRLAGDGAGHFTPVRISLAAITNGLGPSAIAVGDFDENGTPDVAVSDVYPVGGPNNWTRSFIDVLRGDGHGAFALASRYAVPESSQDGIVAADIDGDGHLDLASTGAWFAPGRPGAKVNIAFGNGVGGVRDVRAVWGLAEFPTGLAAADLDGDGRVDLVVNDGQTAFGLAPAPAYSVLTHVAAALPPPTTTMPATTITTTTRTTTTTTSTTSSTTSTTTRTTTTTTSTTTTTPPVVLSFGPTADTYVDAGAATTNYGTKTIIAVDASPIRIAYLRFAVSGIGGRRVVQAVLRLTVDSSSDAVSSSGGRVRRISNTTWGEKSITYKTRPALDGTVLATRGAVTAGAVVDLDVTAALPGDGTYSFALDSTVSDAVRYRTREASSGKPKLLVSIR